MIDSKTPYSGFSIEVPKIIWQTGYDDFNDLKYPFNLNVKTWQQLNPNWEYRYANQEDKRSQIKDFGDKHLSELSEYVDGVLLADLWRYVIVFKYGGVYADLDTVARLPLDLLKYNITNFLNETFIMPDLGEWGYYISPNYTKILNEEVVYCQGCYDFTQAILNREGNKKFYRTNSCFASKKESKPLEYVLDEVKLRFSLFKEKHNNDFDGSHGSINLCVDCSVWDYAINKNTNLVAQNFIYEYNSPRHTDLNGKKTVLFKEDFIDYEILMINKTSYNNIYKHI